MRTSDLIIWLKGALSEHILINNLYHADRLFIFIQGFSEAVVNKEYYLICCIMAEGCYLRGRKECVQHMNEKMDSKVLSLSSRIRCVAR
jgi:hypothetical protein